MSVRTVSEEEFNKETLKYVDCVAEQLGGKVCEVSDEWFAPATNMLKTAAPFFERVFIPTGLKMDGWESKRHNKNEFDHCIIKLGVDSARVKGALVDTAYFVGNYAPAVSIEGAVITDESKLGEATWEPIVEKQICKPSHKHFYVRDELTEKAYTHIRVCQYPDGGIARLRLYAQPMAIWPQDKSTEVDLAHIANGGVAVGVSDQHFGSADNLVLPGRGVDMSDGWETTRSREPGHTDWAILKLGAKGNVNRVIIDTAHYLGNYPQSVTLHGLNADEDVVAHDDSRWTSIVPQSKTSAGVEHEFKELDCGKSDVFSHVKLTMIPDGGVKRVRVLGNRS